MRGKLISVVLFWSFASGSPLMAHTGIYPRGDTSAWWIYWNADPLILANVFWISACYVAGFRWMRAQRGGTSPVRPWQSVSFAAGIFFLLLALISPIDAFAVELLSIHMVQHMLLMNLAAPLFVLGAPVRTMLWLLPPAARQSVGRWTRALERRGVPRYTLWQPLLLWVLYGAVLWVWHLPALYEAALLSPWIHDVQHLMFFGASCLFWRVMFDPIGRLRMSQGLAVVYLFTTSLHATLLGVFMALGPRLWYPTYADRAPAWGVPALADQQLAGYIMWMPACMAYAIVAAVLFARWLHEAADPAASTPTDVPQPGAAASSIHDQ